MPPVRLRGDGRKAKNPGKTLLRLMSYMRKYIPVLILVLLCIIITAVAQTTGSQSLGTLVDDYILPMVKTGSTDFAPLISFLVKLACIFGAGIMLLNLLFRSSFPPILQSPINCGAFAMIAGLILVPIVSFVTKAPDAALVDSCFACYEEKVLVSAKRALSDKER